MKLINWTPRPISLFDNMDRMVQTIFDNDFYPATADHNWVPAVDIRENPVLVLKHQSLPNLASRSFFCFSSEVRPVKGSQLKRLI